jgi:hypothetical protein
LAFFNQNKAELVKNWITTLVFEENAIFAENCDHNIDPGWTCEKNRLKCSPTHFLPKFILTFSAEKSIQKYFYSIQKHFPKIHTYIHSNRSVGENSPNLVTLTVSQSYDRELQRRRCEIVQHNTIAQRQKGEKINENQKIPLCSPARPRQPYICVKNKYP